MTTPTSSSEAARGTQLSYVPALDGIRGVGMLNILGVHAGVWLTGGGFYLLDSFFSLSGFLITSLLIVEWQRRGTIKLAKFWARRARRLLPALFLMLLGVAFIYGVLVPRGTYPGLRGDALSSLFYFANWHFILSSSNYFDQSALTSPLIHMWSLAVEEQFYLIWPLIVVGVLTVWKSLRVLLVVCVVGALASATEMALLFKPTDTTRLYFGTDTHAQSVLVGAALAVAMALWAQRRATDQPTQLSRHPWAVTTPSGRRWLMVLGSVGVVISALMYMTVKSTDPFAYRGGFLLASLAATAVLISVSCVQDGPVAKVFCFPPFTFVGRISYGMYLWHFPLFIYINHARTGLTGWSLFGVRFVPTLTIAIASFYLVEQPVRTGTFLTRRRAWVLTPVSFVAVAGSVVIATVAPVVGLAAAAPPSAIAATPVQGVPASFDHEPVRVLLVGDSEALTLGFGLKSAAHSDPQRYNITIADQGILACGVADGTTFTKMGQAGQPVGWPCSPDPAKGNCAPGGLFNPTGHFVPCQSWTSAWAQWISQVRPNVVVLLAGGAEVLDRVYEGRTTNILHPAFARYVKSQLEKAESIATAAGALMIMETKPCQDTGEQLDGQPWPEDSPKRQAVYNSLLRQVAAEHPGKVYVQDLNSYVCPHGNYTATLHGLVVRNSDGIHFSMAAGQGGAVLAPALLPMWVRVGHLQEALTGGKSIVRTPLPPFLAPS